MIQIPKLSLEIIVLLSMETMESYYFMHVKISRSLSVEKLNSLPRLIFTDGIWSVICSQTYGHPCFDYNLYLCFKSRHICDDTKTLPDADTFSFSAGIIFLFFVLIRIDSSLNV